MRERLTILVPRVGFAALVIACVLVPILFTRQTAEAFMVPKVTVLWLSLIVAAVGLATWSLAARRRPLPRTSITWPATLLFAWTALATVLSASPGTSVVGAYGRYDGLIGLLAGLLTAAAVVGYTWRSPDRLRWIVFALLVSGVIGSAYITIQQVGWDWIDWYTESLKPIEQPYGLLGNSNFSGAHLALLVPLALSARTWVDQRWAKAALLALVGWFAISIWWTGTRGGLLAMAGAVGVAGILDHRIAPKLVRWGALAATVAALGLVVVASTRPTLSVQERVGRPAVLQSNTLADRKEIWTASKNMLRDHPVVGVGPDAFGLEFPYYRLPLGVDEAPLNADEAHDIFLDRAVTAGLPALAAYLWLVGAVGWATWRARRTIGDEQRWLLGAFGGLFGGYVLQGLVSIDVVPLAMAGWLGIGALTVLADPKVRMAAAEEPAVDRLRAVPLGAFAGLGLAALLLASLAVRPFIADLRFRDGLEAVSQGRPGAVAAADFEAATDWLGTEPRYHAKLADQLVYVASREVPEQDRRAALLQEAVLGYDAALDRAPDDPRILRSKARAYVILSDAESSANARDTDLAQASRIYHRLVEGIPGDKVLRIEYGLVLEGQAARATDADAPGLRDRAIAQFEEARRIDGSATDAMSALARIAVVEGRLDDAHALLLQAHQTNPDDEGIERALEQVEADLAEQQN